MNESSNILLSIVTINKNSYVGLKATAESIKKHAWNEKLEWIIVDGGSTDESVNYLRQLTGSIIQLHETNLGLYESMNYGADLATGKYLIFMNSGDRFTETGIDHGLFFVEKNNCDWIVAQSIAVDSIYEWKWDWPVPSIHSLGFRLGFRSFCHQSTFVKKATFDRLGGFETDSLFSDWQMSLKLAEISRPLVVDEFTTEYLIGGLSSKMGSTKWAIETGRLRRRTNSKFLSSRTLDISLTPLLSIYMKWKRRK
jgi:glycosyltransferase involved in cell wall biosynthesis